MKKTLLIGGAGALFLLGLLLGALLAGPLLVAANAHHATATKAATTPGADKNPYCQQYEQNFVKQLGISTSTLQQARNKALEAVLAQLVKDGKITQAQSDLVKQREGAQPGPECSAVQRVPLYIGGQFFAKYGKDIFNQIAQGLKLTPQQLASQLQSGKSLDDIAAQKNVSVDVLQVIVTDAVDNAADKAVSARDLSRDQANRLKKLASNQNLLNLILDYRFSSKQNLSFILNLLNQAQ